LFIKVDKSSVSSINLFFLRDFAGWIFNLALFIKKEQRQDQRHHLRNVKKAQNHKLDPVTKSLL